VRASCSLQLPQAFLLGEEHIKKLCKLLDERIGHVEIKAACVDQLEREFKDSADLVKYENTKAAEINRLSMTAWSDNREKRVSLVFCGDPTRIRGISIDIAADDSVVLRLKSDILDIVSGTRPWFNSLSSMNSAGFILPLAYLLLPLILSLLVLKLARLSIIFSRPPDATNITHAYVLTCVAIVAYIAIVWGAHRVFKHVFPHSVFLLGQGKARYNFIEKLQWGVVIGFVVSLAAGVILTVFLTFFT
jgi:hypothetical protein